MNEKIRETIRKLAVLHCGSHRIACQVRWDYFLDENWKRCNCDFADDKERELKKLFTEIEEKKS